MIILIKQDILAPRQSITAEASWPVWSPWPSLGSAWSHPCSPTKRSASLCLCHSQNRPASDSALGYGRAFAGRRSRGMVSQSNLLLTLGGTCRLFGVASVMLASWGPLLFASSARVLSMGRLELAFVLRLLGCWYFRETEACLHPCLPFIEQIKPLEWSNAAEVYLLWNLLQLTCQFHLHTTTEVEFTYSIAWHRYSFYS